MVPATRMQENWQILRGEGVDSDFKELEEPEKDSRVELCRNQWVLSGWNCEQDNCEQTTGDHWSHKLNFRLVYRTVSLRQQEETEVGGGGRSQKPNIYIEIL